MTLASQAAASRNARADEDNVIRASYLVARDEVGYFASVVRDLQDDHPELAVSCTGPWAPYSFAMEAGL